MRQAILSASLAILAVAGWAGNAVAQNEVIRFVHLDDKKPAEAVVSADGKFTILVWNPGLKKWIEIFAGSGPYEVGSMKDKAFADITNGGYLWSWDGARYTPQIPRADVPNLTDVPTETLNAVAKAVGANVPPTTGAVAYDDDDGSKVLLVVLDQDSATCTGDGTTCSGVVVRDGKIGADVGASVGYGYRISKEANAARHRLIEQGTDSAVVVKDTDTGAVVRRIEPSVVKIADVQPNVPTDQE